MRHRRHPRAAAAIALILVGAVATSCGRAPTASASLRFALTAAKARWAAANVTSYSFTAWRSCECTTEGAGPVRITIAGGQFTAVKLSATNASVDPGLWFDVPGLFGIIERELAERPDLLEAEFDSELGYPTRIKYGDVAVDAGAIIMVTGFTRH